MKKDILKVFLAITFIILALITGAYLKNLQDNAEKQVQQNKNIEDDQIYVNNLSNKSFNLPVLLIDTSGQQLSREEEITAKVFEEHANEIFDEAENRLHVQKAIITGLKF